MNRIKVVVAIIVGLVVFGTIYIGIDIISSLLMAAVGSSDYGWSVVVRTTRFWVMLGNFFAASFGYCAMSFIIKKIVGVNRPLKAVSIAVVIIVVVSAIITIDCFIHNYPPIPSLMCGLVTGTQHIRIEGNGL